MNTQGEKLLKPNWHLERTVSVSHILSTLFLFGALVSAYSTMSSRLAILESQQINFNERIVAILENQRTTDVRQDSEINETKRLIREDVREISTKIDQLIREISK